MAYISTENVEQEVFAVGSSGQSREAEHVPPSLRTTTMFLGAHDLQFANSTFSLVGGDHIVHNHHYHHERLRDIWAILQSIPNFRNVYQDILSKVTPGTGMWLIKRDKFGLWIEPNGVIKIFWGSGIPGAGKTLLATIIIEHLETLRRASEAAVCICYVYFRYSDRSEMTVRNVLEVLVKQTVERHPDCLVLVEQTYAQHLREGSEPTEAQLLALLRELAGRMAATFYILDALDEAPTRIQLAVVQTLASLHVKLFITSRPLEDVEEHFPEAYIFPIAAKDDDIDLHISKVISKSANLQKLFRRAEPSLREDMIATIKQNCGGMFLHASLQLDALSECVSAREARGTLQAFPSRIEEVYHRSWARISSLSHNNASLAKAVLVWVLNASRSMTIEELERALATCPITHKFEPDRHVSGSTLMSLCHGLVVVEEETRLVRLVHYTAKDTLEGHLCESFPNPHSLLAAVCMTHLAGCGFQKTTMSSEEEFETALKDDPLLAYASDAWAFHALAGMTMEETRRQMVQFVTEIDAFPAFTSPDRTSYFDILTPLHIVGLYHLPLDFIRDSIKDNLNVTTTIRQQSALITACQSGHEDLVAYLVTLSDIEVNLVDGQGWSALMQAAKYGHEGIVKLLLVRPEVQINLVKNDGWSALMLAARNGYEGIVKLLLARPEVQINLVSNHGLSALMLAAYAGHNSTAQLILAHPEVQINLVDSNGWSALMSAARYCHEGVVVHLLAHPDVQINLVKNDGQSALMLAAMNGYDGIVKLLLARPEAQTNLVGNHGLSALMLAAYAGHNGTAQLLLAHSEVQINLVDNDGWSALMSAARYGHEGVVVHLLAHPDVQINLVKNDGRSALMLASRFGHEGIVKLLLAHPNIQINIVDKKGWSALMVASRNGHASVAALLLPFPGIQLSLTSDHSSTALLLAAEHGHNAIVELLLATGAFNINGFDNDGDTAIKMAAKEGHESIVRLLLDIPNIDVTIKSTKDGHTAISAAQANGHNHIVKLLQEFELRNVVVPSAPAIDPPSGHDSHDEDGSDSDSSEAYFDAEE